MAGLGKRFFSEKYRLPKPFIPVQGKDAFITAVNSFPRAQEYIFIAQEEHIKRYKMEKKLNNIGWNHRIVALNQVTEGQACTCLLAKDFFKKDLPLFIASCDYQMIYDEALYQSLLNDPKVDIIIWTFKIKHIKKARFEDFAYCRINKNSKKVEEIVEKQVISNNPENDHAVVGSFTYKRSQDFVLGAEQMIQKNIRINNEFYVGTSINQLIEAGYHVVAFEIDQFISFGTPLELELMQYWEEFFKKEDI